MEKLKMKSRDVVDGNVEKIVALFPQCVTERLNRDGKPEFAIDFDKLRAELSGEVLDEGEERYQFTWPDKRAASRLANESANITLRPCREASVDFDTTQNLYIKGDNLDVLKVLSVDDDSLLACFDTDVNETTIEEMAKLLPTHLIIRDASAANDNVLDNFDQIIESYSNKKKITTHIL